MSTPTKRRRVKAAPDYSQDPQVHGPDAEKSVDTEAPKPGAAGDPSTVMVKTNPVELEKKDDDSILNEPLKYVVSAPEAIDRAEVLLEKVKEARPDLADQVDQLLDGVESLEKHANGTEAGEPALGAPAAPEGVAPTPEPQPTPNQAQPAVQPGAPAPEGALAPGDRVKATTKDGEFTGVVEDVNEDGTLEILTDKNMKLSHVPVDSVEKEEEGSTGSMALPAGIQSSRRQNVRKTLKASEGAATSELGKAEKELGTSKDLARRAREGVKKPAAAETLIDLSKAAAEDAGSHLTEAKDAVKAEKTSPEKGMGAGRTATASKGAVAGSLDPQAEMAVKAARQQFMAGMLNLELVSAFHPAAQAEVARLMKDKSLKFAASAFDKLESLDLGGGMKAKRGPGDDKDEVKTVVVTDADGKQVAKYPDAFGDDTVTIIKLFRQLHDISEADDKQAAKAEGSESEGESKKPKAMPKVEEKSKSDEDKDLEAAQKNFEQRLEVVRAIVADRVNKRYVVAQQDVIDAHLLKGMGLEASMNEALKAAVDTELMRLLALPDTELLSIRASLGGLKPRPVEVETKVSNEGLQMVAGLQVYVEKAQDDGLDISGAFGSSFRRR